MINMNFDERVAALRKFHQCERRLPGYKEMLELFGYRSKNAVHKLVLRLVEAGYLIKRSHKIAAAPRLEDEPGLAEQPVGSTDSGEQLLDSGRALNLLGVDIGGTKTAVCLGNQKGEILATQRIPAMPGEDPQVFKCRLNELVGAVLESAGLKADSLDAVGISAPGPLSVPRGMLLAPPNTPGWHEVPIFKMVSEMVKAPVFLNNDANACALAEMFFGEHRGIQSLIYLTFSTGMGAGIITNGRLVQGITDCGGEVGHMVLDLHGPRCGCGNFGCWETYVGGRNVAERLKARIRAGGLKTAIVDQAGGEVDKIDMKALSAAVRLGDPLAVEEWESFTDRLAQGIGALVQVINPEIVILGTIAIHERDLVMPALQAKLPKYAWRWPLEACRIVPSSLEGRIGDLSALAVAITGLRETGNGAMRHA